MSQRRSITEFMIRPDRRPAVWFGRWHWAFLWVALVQLMAQPLWAAPPAVAPASQQEYWARFDARDWEAAITSAEALVAASRPATPTTALPLSEALSLLGSAQLSKGNLVAAEAAFAESLKLAEQHSNSGSSRLVEPLRGLGYTLAAEGNHAQAVPYMDRALIISRRNAGLFDVAQQGLLRQLIISLTTLGQPADAERHVLYLLRVGEHAYGATDPRMVPLRCTVGEWYTQLGQTEVARQHFHIALDIAERKLGRDDLATVAPLRSLARSYSHEVLLSQYGILTRHEQLPSNMDGTGGNNEPLNPRYLSTDGERALIRAIKLLDANPQRSDATLIETLLQTGDWFLMKQQPPKALPYYERAAAIIKLNAGAQTPGTSPLGFPLQVYYPTPFLAIRNLQLPPNQVDENFVQIEFTVKQDGSTADEHVVDQKASERQIAQTLEAVRDARYRPKFVDGKAVDTAQVSYRQVFRQRKESE